MKEDFLQYIWNQQYFDKTNLTTTTGEPICILSPGYLNTNAGPDFSQARLKIGRIEWVGQVEVHYKSSGWQQHKHAADKAYDNVILHVVWRDDRPVLREDGSRLATLELRSRIDYAIIEKYSHLLNNPEDVICNNSLPKVSSINKLSMLERAAIQRLQRKAQRVLQIHAQVQHDWDQAAYILLAENFGFKLNNVPFARLAQILTYKTLVKHSANPMQLEALLYGCAGLLEKEFHDDYL